MVQISKLCIGITVVIIILLATIVIIMAVLYPSKHIVLEQSILDNDTANGQAISRNDVVDILKPYMTPKITAPPLVSGGVVRVYVSGGMFDIADTLFAVGADGMKPGLDYQSINLVDMICDFSDGQWKELKDLCTLWDVPWYGVTGEIEKMGWQSYTPVRDGLTMATLISAVNSASAKDLTSDDPKSLFFPANMKKELNLQTLTDTDITEYAIGQCVGAIGTCIGANDLYNMYSTCNACLMNYNGIQADAGALAEIGQLGARGVPIVILKGQISGDFGGITNPMPLMASSAGSALFPHLTNNPGSVYAYDGGTGAALLALKNKVNRFIEADSRDDKDYMSIGDYNAKVPLPPLQIFWSNLGQMSYSLKHRSEAVATLPNGKTDFTKDYTKFWYDNVVPGHSQGLVTVSMKFADNLAAMIAKPEYQNVYKYWT
jgi:hypothetical protein